MSADPSPDPAPQPVPAAAVAVSPPAWDPLTPLERRILGVLIEKQKTAKTPDTYPLTLNALVTGCNQKSNRDPVMDLDEIEVEEGLTALLKKGIVNRVQGGRVERFKHELYEKWTKNGPEMAVICELLLRGPQTKGDLRGRAARMAPIDTLDSLDAILKSLISRRLALYLTDPDRRGAVVTHGFHTADELVKLKAQAASAPASVSLGEPGRASTAPSTALEAKLSAAVEEIEALRSRVASLESTVLELRKHLPPSPGSM